MKPDLKNVKHVAFRKFGKDDHDVPVVKHWAKGAVADGQAWERIAKHLNGSDTNAGPLPSLHTELSLPLEHGKCAYIIAFDDDIQTAFGPGPSPITLLPPGLNAALLGDVGLIYAAGTSDPVFVAACDIPTELGAMRAGGALIFTCERTALEKVWKEATPEGHTPTPIALPFALNLYDTKSQLPVWAIPAQLLADGDGVVLTHGGIHPSSNSHILY